jgi:hypothetical protein
MISGGVGDYCSEARSDGWYDSSLGVSGPLTIKQRIDGSTLEINERTKYTMYEYYCWDI